MNKEVVVNWDRAYQSGVDYRQPVGRELDLYLTNITKPKEASFLDIGCGSGLLTREMFHRGVHPWGIDTSKEAIKLARLRTTRKIEYCETDLAGFIKSNPDLIFDIIVCRLTYAFIDNKDDFLRMVSNIINKSGVFYILTPILKNTPPLRQNIAIDPKIARQKLEEYFIVEDEEFDNLMMFKCRLLR